MNKSTTGNTDRPSFLILSNPLSLPVYGPKVKFSLPDFDLARFLWWSCLIPLFSEKPGASPVQTFIWCRDLAALCSPANSRGEKHGWPLWNCWRELWPKLWGFHDCFLVINRTGCLPGNMLALVLCWRQEWEGPQMLLWQTLFGCLPENQFCMFCVNANSHALMFDTRMKSRLMYWMQRWPFKVYLSLSVSPLKSFAHWMNEWIWMDPVTCSSVPKCVRQCEASDVENVLG